MTFSTMTVADVISYLRLGDITTDERNLLVTIFNSAKSYVLKYTGLTAEQA